MVEGKDQPPLPPLLRKVNRRELLRIAQARRQIGLPTSIDAEASLGWALYAYMAAGISMNHCNGARRILLRVLGSCSKDSEAPKINLSQRAKCGVCPSCVRATNVLIPATYGVGACDRRKANAAKLWQLYGPMATRNYGAAWYFTQFGCLPSGWNWIAIKHVVMLPPLLDPEGRRNVEAESSRPSESLLALEDMRRSRPMPMCSSPVTSRFSPAP